MNLAKLTSLSTSTLSLLLERQRLQTMTAAQAAPSSNTQQIIRNLSQLRTGILALEESEAAGGKPTEASRLLRSQFGRMREMLGREGEGIEPLAPLEEAQESNGGQSTPSSSSSSKQLQPGSVARYIPYSDEPPPSPENEPGPAEILEQQRLIMNEQDTRLDRLSESVGRQHHISIHINDELTVHNGLLDELGHDVDRTHDRLSGARKKLDKFSRGVKGNLSAYLIAAIILVLLILIIIFKT